jgi:hypothetical protein
METLSRGFLENHTQDVLGGYDELQGAEERMGSLATAT